MKNTVKHALHKACGKDERRPAFGYIWFHNGFAYATDAHVAVTIPTHEIFTNDQDACKLLDGKLIHRDIWRTMVFGKRCLLTTDGTVKFALNSKQLPSYDVPFSPKGEMKMPNIDSVWPLKKDANPLHRIGVNPSFLLRATQAINVEAPELTFFYENKAILVTHHSTDGEAIVMPVMINH